MSNGTISGVSTRNTPCPRAVHSISITKWPCQPAPSINFEPNLIKQNSISTAIHPMAAMSRRPGQNRIDAPLCMPTDEHTQQINRSIPKLTQRKLNDKQSKSVFIQSWRRALPDWPSPLATNTGDDDDDGCVLQHIIKLLRAIEATGDAIQYKQTVQRHQRPRARQNGNAFQSNNRQISFVRFVWQRTLI